jgi:pilus assembly protein CpaB
MKPARLAVIAIALLSGLAAFFLAGRKPPPQTIEVIVPQKAEAIATDEILVTTADQPMGSIIVKGKDFKWQTWPHEGISQYMIKRSDQPNAETDVDGSIVRNNFLAGEPLRKDKLVKGNGSGFLSAILPTGKRAMAISIDTTGANSAGGFILPNDTVDILRTYRDDPTSSGRPDAFSTEVILTNIRVLAIAQTVQEENGKKTLTGNTATLELDPREVELLTVAQRTGTLSLVLRSLVDRNKVNELPVDQSQDQPLTVVRFGVSQAAGKK